MSYFPNQFVLADQNGYPLHPFTHQKYNAHDSAIWLDLSTVNKNRYPTEYVGFVVSKKDPHFIIDIDHGLEGGKWSPLACEIYHMFTGCYREISKSGIGLHIIGTYTRSLEHKCKNIKSGLELYTENRMVALTFMGANGDPNFKADIAYRNIINRYLKPTTLTVPAVSAVSADKLLLSDDEILQKAFKAKSGKSIFGKNVSFEDLWWGNFDKLAQAYPSNNGRPYDYSSADAALCQHLAFWTNRNPKQIERIFNQSALIRNKWTQRPDYRNRTIDNAIALCTQVYTPVIINPTIVSGLIIKPGYQLVTSEQQIELFKDCVYIASIHKILDASGMLMKPDVFKVMYGGRIFTLDAAGQKTTTNAFTAFTENQAIEFQRARSICFRPEFKPRRIIQEEGWSWVNSYVPIETTQKDGDISPFLNHLRIMLPNEQDTGILLAYMASVAQYPGKKFSWAPLLQGFPGNGKTLIINALQHIVGKRYTHFPKADELNTKFNGWLFGKLFIGVEEIHVITKSDIIETLKRYVTNARIEIQGKGQDQVMGDNRANFLFCSNYKDALPKLALNRRYCVLYTAQQCLEDLVKLRWCNTTYFPNLFNWAEREGYAIINRWLHNYTIPKELNPATICHYAPTTSSVIEAITVSRTKAEQEIIEAITEELPGFKEGWISSKPLSTLLDQKRIQISPNKRTELLASLGYIKHPGLKDGRSNQIILQENGKPRLYISKYYPKLLNLSNPVQKYLTDQKYSC